MTDTPTPTTTLTYAKAAAAALREVQALPREQLAGNPADVYDLIDELLPAVFDLSRICDQLAGQLNDWAALAATGRRAGDLPERLHTAAVAAGHAQRQPRLLDASAHGRRPRRPRPTPLPPRPRNPPRLDPHPMTTTALPRPASPLRSATHLVH